MNSGLTGTNARGTIRMVWPISICGCVGSQISRSAGCFTAKDWLNPYVNCKIARREQLQKLFLESSQVVVPQLDDLLDSHLVWRVGISCDAGGRLTGADFRHEGCCKKDQGGGATSR